MGTAAWLSIDCTVASLKLPARRDLPIVATTTREFCVQASHKIGVSGSQGHLPGWLLNTQVAIERSEHGLLPGLLSLITIPVSRSIFSINSSDPNGRPDEIVLRIFVNVSRLLRLASSDSVLSEQG